MFNNVGDGNSIEHTLSESTPEFADEDHTLARHFYVIKEDEELRDSRLVCGGDMPPVVCGKDIQPAQHGTDTSQVTPSEEVTTVGSKMDIPNGADKSKTGMPNGAQKSKSVDHLKIGSQNVTDHGGSPISCSLIAAEVGENSCRDGLTHVATVVGSAAATSHSNGSLSKLPKNKRFAWSTSFQQMAVNDKVRLVSY